MTGIQMDDSTEKVQDAVQGAPPRLDDSATETDLEVGEQQDETSRIEDADQLEWENAPENPQNWPAYKKVLQVVMLSSAALLSSIGTSIMSPARSQLMAEFNVSSTVALLPLTMYVLALGFGPVIGGPLSETIGRYPIYVGSVPLGALFTIVAGFTHNFGALCFLRFTAGLCWGPVMAVASGSLVETFRPKSRGPVSAVFVLMPFLGPGLGPVIGSFVVNRKDWRWTQWALAFLAVFTMLTTALTQETFHPVIQRRLAKKRGAKIEKSPPWAARLKTFAVLRSQTCGAKFPDLVSVQILIKTPQGRLRDASGTARGELRESSGRAQGQLKHSSGQLRDSSEFRVVPACICLVKQRYAAH